MYWRRLAGSGIARNLLSQSRSAWSDSAENPRRAGESAGVASVAESKQQSKVVGRRFIGRIIACASRPVGRHLGLATTGRLSSFRPLWSINEQDDYVPE